MGENATNNWLLLQPANTCSQCDANLTRNSPTTTRYDFSCATLVIKINFIRTNFLYFNMNRTNTVVTISKPMFRAELSSLKITLLMFVYHWQKHKDMVIFLSRAALTGVNLSIKLPVPYFVHVDDLSHALHIIAYPIFVFSTHNEKFLISLPIQSNHQSAHLTEKKSNGINKLNSGRFKDIFGIFCTFKHFFQAKIYFSR